PASRGPGTMRAPRAASSAGQSTCLTCPRPLSAVAPDPAEHKSPERPRRNYWGIRPPPDAHLLSRSSLRLPLVPRIGPSGSRFGDSRAPYRIDMTGPATNSIASRPVTAQVRTFIARRPDVVFDYFADLRNEPQYNRQGREITKTSPGPIARGTRFEGAHSGLGRVTW